MAANCFLAGALQLTNVAEAGRAKESTTSVRLPFFAQKRETMGHPLFVCDLQKCSSPPRTGRGFYVVRARSFADLRPLRMTAGLGGERVGEGAGRALLGRTAGGGCPHASFP
jgi:hypothetical protein